MYDVLMGVSILGMALISFGCGWLARKKYELKPQKPRRPQIRAEYWK